MTGWRKPLIGAGVLALHALLLAGLLDMHSPPPPREEARETTLLLLPLPHPKPPEEKTLPAPTPASHAITITIPKNFVTPPNTETLPGAQGLGMALGCGAPNYDSLSPAERASCKHGPWGYDAQARETASLIIKAPPPPMSAADRAWRIRSTTDPCGAEKLAHIPFCIHKIIYGDKLP
ncbi:MAG TPA: hypothetical protein VHU87_05185 [Rhizomicrobium sp.]|jgi:hypothetical protein|nr:hypothetical protein [Rhizomicrobium sp.]